MATSIECPISRYQLHFSPAPSDLRQLAKALILNKVNHVDADSSDCVKTMTGRLEGNYSSKLSFVSPEKNFKTGFSLLTGVFHASRNKKKNVYSPVNKAVRPMRSHTGRCNNVFRTHIHLMLYQFFKKWKILSDLANF